MPTEIEIDAIINTDRSQQGLKELSKSLRELISLQSKVAAGSEQFKRLQNAINDTEGKIGDLNDSFQTLRGSGVERLNGSIGLLKEGFLSADPGKLSIGLDGLGAAMKAIPIFLLIEAAKSLYENWEKLTAIFSDSAKKIKANEEALKDLNEQVSISRVQSETILIAKNQELKAIERQGEAYEEIINKIKEIDGLTQGNLRNDLKLTDKEVQNQIEKLNDLKKEYENRNLREIVFQFFGSSTGTTKEELKEAERVFEQLIIKRGDAANKIVAQTADTADKISELEKQIRDRDENTRRTVAELRIQDIFKDEERELAARREQYKQEQYDNKENQQILKALAIAFNNDIIDIEKNYGAIRAGLASENRRQIEDYEQLTNEAKLQDAALAAQKLVDIDVKNAQDIIAVNKYLKEKYAEQDAEIEAKNEAKRRLRDENRKAYEQAFQKESLSQKITFIEQERDTALLNEDLTQRQRIAIIEKAENDILKIKISKDQEYLAYAQQSNSILNSLSAIQTQNQDYQLQEQGYRKDEAIEKDTERTQQEIDREELKKNQLLNNDQLTSDERERIAYDSETRQLAISNSSKITQAKLLEDFNKKETEIRKKQFERNKALQIVTGIINTAASVLQTMAAVPYPANIPLAILAGIAGAAQVAVIATQKFDAGPNTSAASTSIDTRGGISSGGGGFSSSSPSHQSPVPFDPNGQANSQTSTTINDPVKVYVLESDIRNVTNKIDVIESRATFP